MFSLVLSFARYDGNLFKLNKMLLLYGRRDFSGVQVELSETPSEVPASVAGFFVLWTYEPATGKHHSRNYRAPLHQGVLNTLRASWGSGLCMPAVRRKTGRQSRRVA